MRSGTNGSSGKVGADVVSLEDVLEQVLQCGQALVAEDVTEEGLESTWKFVSPWVSWCLLPKIVMLSLSDISQVTCSVRRGAKTTTEKLADREAKLGSLNLKLQC